MSLPSTTMTTAWVQPLSNPPHNPTTSPTENDLKYCFHVWLHDAAIWYAPLLDGRQFKHDWRKIVKRIIKSRTPGTQKDERIHALEVFFAAANKDFKWCPATSIPHSSPNVCAYCNQRYNTDVHLHEHQPGNSLGLEERVAKLWYSSEAGQNILLVSMPIHRSVFWPILDIFLDVKGDQVVSSTIQLLETRLGCLEDAKKSSSDEVEHLEKSLRNKRKHRRRH
jgi:hypothetical protein